MTSGAENLTLKEVQNLRSLMPSLAARVDMELASTYDDFVICVYTSLDSIIEYIEEDPKEREKDSEDRLTLEIIGMLKREGYNASHDTKIGGHTDICVKNRQGHIWLGEAKIHTAYDELLKGFNQLCTRYSSGAPNSSKGALLIYIRAADAMNVMKTWKDHLKSNNQNTFEFEACEKRSSLSFFSTHVHQRSGSPYQVRHMGILQHFNPKDKK